MATTNVLRYKVLPALIYPALSVAAIYIIFGHAYGGGTWERVEAHCALESKLPHRPYFLQYTGNVHVDYQLCGLVTVFEVLKQPKIFPFAVDIMSGLGGLATLTSIEAARTGSHAFLAWHVLISLIYQRATAAALIPWWFLGFVATGAATLPNQQITNKGFITQPRAEAVALSVIGGYILPALGLLFGRTNYYLNALWQPFPLLMFIIEKAYLLVRPSTKGPSDGYATLQLLYTILFVGSAGLHLYYVTPISADVEYLKFLFVPATGLAVPNRLTNTLEAGVFDLIQWDFIFVSSTALFSFLYSARSVLQAIGIFVGFLAASVALGPGAAFAGYLAWREYKIQASLVVEPLKLKDD